MNNKNSPWNTMAPLKMLARITVLVASLIFFAACADGPPRGARDTADASQDANAVAALKKADESGDGSDVVTLLARNKIEVEARGHDIQRVSLRIRKLTPESVRVRIPTGTFFMSANQGPQNMVATASNSVTLSNDKWHQVSQAVACASHSRRIPGLTDTFTILRSPFQVELAALMPVLESAHAAFPVRQAAVWIVTDNAGYSALLTLRDPARRTVGPVLAADGSVKVLTWEDAVPAQAITETDITHAMKLCEKAGIDITRKAIWHSRIPIMKGVRDPSLKSWLAQKADSDPAGAP